jgi:cytidine deaminase
LADSEKAKPKSSFASQRSGNDRRTGRDRRSGAERRTKDLAVDKERRSGQERRKGERRSGRDRREGWMPIFLDDPAEDPALEGVLVEAALAARERAHAPFSNFKVGAALETATGDIITGCNVENATYGLTMCAERVAIFKAISDGHREFARVAVVADTAAPTPPCGACRQLLWEFCGDVEVVLANLEGVTGRTRLAALLPLPFDARLL